MYTNEDIKILLELVIEVADPDKVILFGSYAYGNPNPNSDIDLLVIKNGDEITIDQEAELSTSLYFKRKERKLRLRYDVFFQTERQAKKIAENGGAFQEALVKGRVIYERGNKQKRRAAL